MTEFSMEDMLGVGVGYGQKEEGKGLGTFDFNYRLQQYPGGHGQAGAIPRSGRDCCQFIYPTLACYGRDKSAMQNWLPAHCRAYNTWTLDVCAGHRERLYPVGHISLRHPQAAVRELERLAKAGVRTVFVGALPSTARARLP